MGGDALYEDWDKWLGYYWKVWVSRWVVGDVCEFETREFADILRLSPKTERRSRSRFPFYFFRSITICVSHWVLIEWNTSQITS